MIGFFKRTAESVQGLTAEVRAIRELLAEGLPVGEGSEEMEARVSALEREVSKRIAEAEALVMRAESKFKAARSAEERERHHREKAEEAEERLASLDDESLDPFEKAGAAWQLHQGDAEGGGEEGVPAVHRNVEVASSPEQVAARRKFGG